MMYYLQSKISRWQHYNVQLCIQKKCLIKYNNINKITPMKTHIDYAHPMLFTHRKMVLANKSVELNHTW
jgi:hypothetical protein